MHTGICDKGDRIEKLEHEVKSLKMVLKKLTSHNSDYYKSGKCESCENLKDCDIESKASCSDFS